MAAALAKGHRDDARAVGVVPRAHAIAHPKWWHVSLEVRPTGLVTDPIPLPGGGTLEEAESHDSHEQRKAQRDRAPTVRRIERHSDRTDQQEGEHQEPTGHQVASDGPHYGENIKLDGPGKYRVRYRIAPPPVNGFYRHTDKETGVGEWWTPFELEWDFIYAGAGKKGGY